MKSKSFKYKQLQVILLLSLFIFHYSSLLNAQNKTTDISPPKIVLKISPGDNNPRNSEGDFIELKDGKLLYIYTHYYGKSSSDHATAYLASRISSDRGKTWSQMDELTLQNEGDMNVMSVSLLRLQTGEIALFYLRKNSDSDCIPMMRISKDEAKSWGEAIPCISDQKGYFVLNNDRVIQAANGRLLLAVSQHNFPDGKFFGKGLIYCYFSDDNGKTWLRSEALANPDNITYQEPGLVFLKDNSLLMFIRTNAGTQCFTKSNDLGKTWGEVTKSQLISPVSPATIERIPSTGDLLAVWNNNLSTNEKTAKKRIPLNSAISKDEGISWQHIKIIDGNPKGWYCYTAMQFIDKAVILGYCAGTETAHLTESHITKIDLSWIYN